MYIGRDWWNCLQEDLGTVGLADSKRKFIHSSHVLQDNAQSSFVLNILKQTVVIPNFAKDVEPPVDAGFTYVHCIP